MIKHALLLIAALVSSLALASPVAAVNTNNFIITNYNIDYQLSSDDQDRSVLKTTETITAQFPQVDQNHGLERAIPTTYDDRSVNLNIDSVTDQAGNSLSYSTSDSGGNQVLRIGDKDSYVHGNQTYVISYTQHDVTKGFNDTGADEFYWDTNGTDWRVPINSLVISLKIDDKLAEQLTGQMSCYKGAYRSSDPCRLQKLGNELLVPATALGPGENVSLSVGFKAGTFAAYQQSLTERLLVVWIGLQIVLLLVAISLIVWLSIRYAKWTNRTSEHDPIVPEYLPPAEASVQTSSTLMPSAASFTAQVIDLAVRHYIQVIQTKQKSGLFGKDEYEIEVIKSVDDLRPEEVEILTDIFATKPAIGSKLNLKDLKKDSAFHIRTLDNAEKLKTLMLNSYGLRAKNPQQSGWYKKFGWVTLATSLVLLSPPLLLLSLIAFALSTTLQPLTDKGLDLMRYLKGLKMYISVAEEERLKMLQSPEGAAKTQIDGSDTRQLVKLYERVLPYAVLFGQEKDWNKQLGSYYETTNSQPDWYSGAGNTAFNAAMFSSAMNSFSATTTSYSSPSSSSSGGSSGGGFSGGGGGGGGGGGW